MKTSLYSGFGAMLVALAFYGCGGDSAASKQTQAAKTEAPLAVTVTPVRTQKVTRSVEVVCSL